MTRQTAADGDSNCVDSNCGDDSNGGGSNGCCWPGDGVNGPVSESASADQWSLAAGLKVAAVVGFHERRSRGCSLGPQGTCNYWSS